MRSSYNCAIGSLGFHSVVMHQSTNCFMLYNLRMLFYLIFFFTQYLLMGNACGVKCVSVYMCTSPSALLAYAISLLLFFYFVLLLFVSILVPFCSLQLVGLFIICFITHEIQSTAIEKYLYSFRSFSSLRQFSSFLLLFLLRYY